MEKICLLTGLEGETSLKKMCIICTFSKFNTETNNYTCDNENVMKIGQDKIIANAKELGFDINSISLNPMLIKAPTKKCGNYQPNFELIQSIISDFFTTIKSNNEEEKSVE